MASLGSGILQDSIAISKLIPNGPITVIMCSINLTRTASTVLINSINFSHHLYLTLFVKQAVNCVVNSLEIMIRRQFRTASEFIPFEI